MREADKRTKTAGFSILQPFIEVAHTPPGDEATETLQQRGSQGESLLAFENVVECIELVRFELIRWKETEPTHVDALDAWADHADVLGQVLAADADLATAGVLA